MTIYQVCMLRTRPIPILGNTRTEKKKVKGETKYKKKRKNKTFLVIFLAWVFLFMHLITTDILRVTFLLTLDVIYSRQLNVRCLSTKIDQNIKKTNANTRNFSQSQNNENTSALDGYSKYKMYIMANGFIQNILNGLCGRNVSSASKSNNVFFQLFRSANVDSTTIVTSMILGVRNRSQTKPYTDESVHMSFITITNIKTLLFLCFLVLCLSTVSLFSVQRTTLTLSDDFYTYRDVQ